MPSKMPSGNLSLPLGDSWVVEGEDEGEYDPTYEDEQRPARRPIPRRPNQSSNSNRSPEPELVMPFLEADTLEGSWTGARTRTNESTLRGSRSTERQETRRRPSRQGLSGSPENMVRLRRVNRHEPSLTSNSAPSTTTSEEHFDATQEILVPTLEHMKTMALWSFDVFGGALRLMKTPISYLLALWFLFGLALIIRNLITTSIYASLSPICRIPGVSLIGLPFCPLDYADETGQQFPKLMDVQSKFEEVMEQSVGGVALSFDMKWTESSMRDLRTLVRHSHLPSRNELALEFDGFIETARIASYDLVKFNSRVGRAVDNVISVTRWTSRVLDGLQERGASRGAIGAFINDKLLAPFQPVKFTERALLDQYVQHTQVVEEEINKLIAEAHALLMVLENLEVRLDMIFEISNRDGMAAEAVTDDFLVQLWSLLGGKTGKKGKATEQLQLLRKVLLCRNSAFAQVSATLMRLKAMATGIEDLRERVGAPELLRDRADIPLSVHIENIERGIDRLEEQRLISKKSEGEQVERGTRREPIEGILIEG